MRIFLKLGGSLITDKDQPYTARRDVIARIAEEISSAIENNSQIELLVGHGSGSFGHYAAKDYGTREKVTNQKEWYGFQKVWHAAHSLNQIVVEEFIKANLPVISLPPSAALLADNRKITKWTTAPIQSALENKLIPVIFGDVIFDKHLGGIIYSTEDLFQGLIPKLQPDKILLAGKEEGVWENYPENTKLITEICAEHLDSLQSKIKSSESIDVTGGMATKVELMINIVKEHPQTEITIFSGEHPGSIFHAISGAALGTTIKF